MMEKVWHKKLEELVQYDWVARMYGVPQSPLYHAEGDVAVHTQMVLDALQTDARYMGLTQLDQQLLWTSALLHDVEKYSTTFTEYGEVVSPGHAKKGAQTARVILYTAFDVMFEQREAVVQLVRHHGLPLWLMHKPDPQRTLLEAAFHTPIKLLNILATADVNGRIASDKNELLERIQFFEAYADEQLLGEPCYPFRTEGAKYYYFNGGQNSEPSFTPFAKYGSHVIITSGLPGMGKDTYIKQNFGDWPVISLDAIRKKHKIKPTDRAANGWVAQQAKEMAQVFLRKRENFVWNATNITRQMRSQLTAMMSNYDAYIEILYIEKPFKVWRQQNQQREAVVPVNVLNKMMYKMEVPLQTEAHRVNYVVSKA